MGLSASKKVEKALQDSPAFNTACDSVFTECMNLTQHAFSGIRPYQLFDASSRFHQAIYTVDPLVKKWVSLPPNRIEVDKAFRIVKEERHSKDADIDLDEFKALSVELYKDAIIKNVKKSVMMRIPIGIVGIGGLGMVSGARRELVGSVMGVYSVAVATAVYLTLSG